MRHLSEGTMRRAVEEPLVLSARERDHLERCARCAEALQAARSDAVSTAGLLGGAAPSVNTARAYAAVMNRIERAPAPASTSALRWGALLRWHRRRATTGLGLAGAAALIGALTLTPASSLAQDFINLFQPKQVAVVQMTAADLQNLSQLQAYGNVQVPGRVQPSTVAGPEAAGAQSGMHVMVPASLPAGVPSDASYIVAPGSTGSFTFSAAKAQATAQRQHESLPPVPAGLDGSTLQVSLGTSVMATYRAQGSDIPTLVVGQMRAPEVSTTGASVTQMEDFVLNLPGVSPALAAQIRALGDPTATLPLPVPVDLAHSTSVTVHGAQGYAIGDATGIGSVVVWEEDGIIHGVGGTVPESTALSVAEGLH